MGVVKALLDTHAFLWWISGHPALSKVAHQVIAEGKNEIYLSSVSVWEIAIKSRAGRLNVITDDLEQFVEQQSRENSFLPLPITLAHSAKVFGLSNHHRDPFDQMLVAQSLVEQIPIISSDKKIHSYDVDVVW